MTVDDIARQIQDRLTVDSSVKGQPKMRDGQPVVSEVYVYHDGKEFLVRVTEAQPPR